MAGLEKARSLYNTELEWMRRQPQARATKPKAREDAFYDLEEKAKQKSKVETREFNVNMQRLGGKILELNYISKKNMAGRRYSKILPIHLTVAIGSG